MKKWTMIIDVAKCHKCNNCLMACKDEYAGNDWPPLSAAQPNRGQYWIQLSTTERASYPLADVAYLPQPCMHCESPDCMKAAKNGAIYQREDGIVIIDPEKSKGQKDIVDACPYGSIFWNEKLSIPQKCTMCAHLLDEGWDKPRCVQACPTGALTFKLEDASGEEGLEDYRPELGTKPQVKYKNLHRITKGLVCGSVALADVNECADNAVVKLVSGGKEVAETTTNNYGDFKFDGLPAEGGSYTITASLEGRTEKSLDIASEGSIYVGVIYL